jgi:hypothetical protein
MLKNPLLQKAQAEVEKVVTDRASFDKIVKAGLRVIYDAKTFAKLSAGLKESQDVVGDIAKGIVGILSLLKQQARGTMPPIPMLQAGMALLFDALDFAEEAGLTKVDNDVLAQATTEFVEALLPTLGLTSQMMQQVLQGVQETVSNPERMKLYEQSRGGAKQ